MLKRLKGNLKLSVEMEKADIPEAARVVEGPVFTEEEQAEIEKVQEAKNR